MEIRRHLGAKAQKKEAKDDFEFRYQEVSIDTLFLSIDTLLVSFDTGFGPTKS